MKDADGEQQPAPERPHLIAQLRLKERPMRRAIGVPLLVLAFSLLNIGLSATRFAQDASGPDNVYKKSVDLVSGVLHRAR